MPPQETRTILPGSDPISRIETAVPSATATPQPASTPSFQAISPIGQSNSYDAVQLKESLATMIDQLGGLSDMIRPGAWVTIKTNLTGGTWSDPALPASPTELFVTHPAIA